MSQPSAPSERLLYPNLTTIGERGSAFGSPSASRIKEQYINDKILANNKLINIINIIKDIRNFYETETNNYNKKLSRYKNILT